MRATAVGLVLISHVCLFFPSARGLFGCGLLAGYFGVELFFVLSGFLIGGILLRELTQGDHRAPLLRFWQRRWLRTLPNYFLFLLINLALAAWLARELPTLLSYCLFLQNITQRPPAFFVESWSLAVEEWFYLLVPVLFLAALKISSRHFQRGSLLVICGVIVAVTLSRVAYVLATHPVWLTDVRMIVLYRLDACMFGVLGAWTKHFHPEQWSRLRSWALPCGLLSLGLNAAVPFVAGTDSVFPQTFGFTMTSLGALLLLPSLDAWRAATGPLAATIVRISIWSYSLYLANLPVRTILVQAMPDSSNLFVAPLFVVCSVVVAAVVYRFYEQPILAWRDQSRSENRCSHLPDTAAVLVKN